MTLPELAPRRTYTAVIATWILAAVLALAVGLLAPEDWRAAWMPVAMGVCFIAAFALNLASGRSQGFIQRIAASVLGALVVMGLIGAGLGLASLFGGAV
ncbi:hypothetical protein N3K63_12280 [Microbacterium sp. W1N]|uniref:hypothetical protein n=1 Tax=Microbacterium festucae TaxID=2977531 RepID=UPI0021BF4383|nr:hypothetical protein [Microbacterium festucae]MCT9821056.1 hypothetical protein [Microbacterium festucae]